MPAVVQERSPSFIGVPLIDGTFITCCFGRAGLAAPAENLPMERSALPDLMVAAATGVHRMDTENDRRDRAYKIWEDEGRPEGKHDDHWKRAGEGQQVSEEEAAEITRANEEAKRAFNDDASKDSNIRPPSTISPD